MAQCKNCLLDYTRHPLLEENGKTKCANCGLLITAEGVVETPSVAKAIVGPGASRNLLGHFFRHLKEIVFHPKIFFQQRAEELIFDGALTSALAFAVIVQWLASFFNFIWRALAGAVVESKFNDLFQIANGLLSSDDSQLSSLLQMKKQVLELFFGAGAILLTPFTTIIKLSFIAVFVHIAVRILVSPIEGKELRFSHTLKILSYASAPWVLCIIPGIGIFLSWFLAFTSSVIGIREVYKTSNFRAILVITFPEFLFFTIFFASILMVLFLAFNFLRMVF